MKVEKIIIILTLVVTILLSTMTVVFADIDPEKYKPAYQPVNQSSDAMKVAKEIIGVVNTVATVIFVGTIVVLGIKYMMGSTEERANYKRTMLPVLIGGILIFGISGILRFIMGIIPTEIS